MDHARDLQRQGRLEEAAAAYEAILAADPGHFEAGYHYSLMLAGRGELEPALGYARAVALAHPEDWRAQAHLGALLAAASRPEEAVPHLRRAIEIEPAHAPAYNNLGAALLALGREEDALECFEHAIEIAPRNADALRNFCRILARSGRRAEALRRLRRLSDVFTPSAVLFDALGCLYTRTGATQEGIAWFERALEIDPAHVDALANLANAQVEIGAIDDARQALLRALQLAPGRANVYRYLAEAAVDAITKDHVEQLEQLARGRLPAIDRVDAYFALGKIYSARGEPRRAFECFSIANAAARSLRPYDESETLRSFSSIRQVFSRAFLDEHQGSGYQSDLPIFIFGMPRSGTSLVEQIVASHPLVHGAGELELFGDLTGEALGRGLNAGEIGELGRRYVEELRELAPAGALRVTDKLPDNSRYAGLIRVALPNARMILVRRDPIETCLSCFQQNFAGENLAWTYDLGELGRYCRAHLDLMQHWREVFAPGAMLEVQYEELVADFETQARRIIEYCGLPWDDRCLEYYKTQRSVRTASAAQVRRPLYRTSINRAREYGDLLKPLIDALGLTV